MHRGCCALRWPDDGRRTAGIVTSRWEALAEAAEKALASGLAEHDTQLREYRATWQRLAETSLLVMARSLVELGAPPDAGIPDLTRFAEDAGVVPRFVPLLAQWRSVLAAAAPAHDDPDALTRRIEQQLDELPSAGVTGRFTDYFRRCARHQTDLLLGRADPLQLLFPDGNMALAESLYSHNPPALVLNRATAALVRVLTDSASHAPMRLLELGAGTGALTSAILPELDTERTRYLFTDVSAYFLSRAKRAFAQYPFVDYALFDVDRPAADQGREPGSVDVVIALNVLHVAGHLHRTLADLRQLLAPGGLLLAVEHTENSAVQMVTIGFIEGFGGYQDHRRETNRAFLTVPDWCSVLGEAGFSQVSAFPGTPETSALLAEHVVLAESPSTG
jgi:SAM-dependent methyltransferase